MDLVQAIYGSTYISPIRTKRFLRNTATEPLANQGPRDPNQCTNEDAPLYTDWLNGPCYIGEINPPGSIDQVLCQGGAAVNLDGTFILTVASVCISVFALVGGSF
jgi:hypothetical protein